MDLPDLIANNRWLLGSIASVGAATLQTLGLALQKKAQYSMMGEKVAPSDPIPSWGQLFGFAKADKDGSAVALFWFGLLLFCVSDPLLFSALRLAPESTITVVKSSAVFVNFILAYGVLHERFTRKDMNATVLCILGLVGMQIAELSGDVRHFDDYPTHEIVELSNDVFYNLPFLTYLITWTVLCVICVYIATTVSMGNVARPFALSFLTGLFYALFHFMSKIALTLSRRAGDTEVQQAPSYANAVVCSLLLYAAFICSSCVSLRRLPCRYFVPAQFALSQSLIVIQEMLLYREFVVMPESDDFLFIIACPVCLLSVNRISALHTTIPAAHRIELYNSPLLSPRRDAVKLHRFVNAIMDEYVCRVPDSPGTIPLETIDMSVDTPARWRWVPLAVCVVSVALPSIFWVENLPFLTFAFLSLFSIYQGWKMGLYIAVFGYVGTKKMAHFDNADFKSLYLAENRESRQENIESRPHWKDVVHYVVLPNYKEELKDLRMAMGSVAASAIAKDQICFVLAMEAREVASQTKAEMLLAEFRDKFKFCFATYHPENIPGEAPGKSANTRWATDELLGKIIDKDTLDNVIFTIADADSEFHPEYFAALTYYFVHAGGSAGQTAQRHLTIWQPPILHMKNYTTQPAIVRLCSFAQSLHELANLADPNSNRSPYSTYSLSARLASAVGGWDPNWISEDWHMFLKTFLASTGRLKCIPIFLPIMNYTPTGDSFVQDLMARWTQAKRHALGFCEVSYFLDHFARCWRLIPNSWDRVIFMWRSFFLLFRLAMLHMFLAVIFILAPFNTALLSFFARHQVAQQKNINSWTFLLSCVFQVIGLVGCVGIFLVSVELFERVKSRVDNGESPSLSIFWRSYVLHFLSVTVQSLILVPVFFVFAALTEWIAAIKTATSKDGGFKYITATEGARGARGVA